ncbi:MAG: diguanylate cyclase [Clostridia bacterium]|nr:diguanylate cyclase [Clostridia bacterium]
MEQTLKNSIFNDLGTLKKITFLDFPSSEIYSKQSYRTIVSEAFRGRKNLSYLYFDVDKLSILNDIDRHLADKALINLLRIIKKNLPTNAIFSRIAGDEFGIILPNTSEEKAKNIEAQIHRAIESLSTFICGLTITSSVSSSLSHSNIDTLETVAEESCAVKKQLKRNQEAFNSDIFFDPLVLKTFDDKDKDGNNVWDTLNNIISSSTNNHLRDLRFNKNYEFDEKAIKQDAFAIVSTISRFIEKNEEPFISKDFDEKDNHYMPNAPKSLGTDASQFILDLLHSSEPKKMLECLSDEELFTLKDNISSLIQYFIRDPHSGLLAKPYLKTFLADQICKANNDYQAIYLSDIGIRDSNTAYGHLYTDMRISKTSKIIQHVLSQFRECNQTAFSFSEEDCHLIDQGGGNYVILIPQNKAMDQREIFKFVTKTNSYVDMQKTNSSFFISSSKTDKIDRTNVEDFFTDVRRIKDIANENKSTLKLQLLSGIDNFNSLKKTMYDCAKYYKENVPDSDNIVKKNAFLTNIFSSLISHQALHNEKISEKKKENNEDLEL